jgi:hypothetical protein
MLSLMLTLTSAHFNLELWKSLEQFQLDDPHAVQPFSARLAREQGWSMDFVARVLPEYLRFIYLTVTCSHPVIPSVVIDRVWHLHLIYTISYWDELCGRVVGRPLHHRPSPGGKDAASLHLANYLRTLASYRRVFGDPPTDIWPVPSPEEIARRSSNNNEHMTCHEPQSIYHGECG